MSSNKIARLRPAGQLHFSKITKMVILPSRSLLLQLEVGPLNAARGLGKHCKLTQWGLGQNPISGNQIWRILYLLYDSNFINFPESFNIAISVCN